ALRSAPASQVPVQSDPAPEPAAKAASPAASSPSAPSSEPLPEHARVRLGSRRFNHGEVPHQVNFTPDVKSLVSLSLTSGSGRVWDAATGRLVRAIGGESARFSWIAVSADGQTLATIEEPGVLRTWELASGRERRTWHAVPGQYQCLAFSPDGRTVAAGLSV